jgi:trans-aconitate 2-methyltransferase
MLSFLIIFLAAVNIGSCDSWNGELYHTYSPEQRYAASTWISQLSLNGDETILDIGCGDGYNTSLLSAKVLNGTVLGIDSSKSMIAFAANTYANDHLLFELMDAHEIDFSSQFNMVVSFTVFHWLKEPKKVLHRVYRSLKPKGRILLEMPCKVVDNLHPIHQAAREVMERPEWKKYYAGFETGMYFRSRDEYESLLLETGFTSVHIKTYLVQNFFDSKDAFFPYLKQWFPYLKPLSGDLKDSFLESVYERYIELAPIESMGIPFHVHRIMIQADKL